MPDAMLATCIYVARFIANRCKAWGVLIIRTQIAGIGFCLGTHIGDKRRSLSFQGIEQFDQIGASH
jgi:hypothetical protein